ncbi:uncharacterized protein LOC136073587 isoform X1 [Hydra vulgaris]|uniref:uncharacterized protein LOC136073587 isoform X1 n=1 Tax=Hydra vulgaris TaxID=6087 RepID=UPI0032EA4D8A
MFISFSFYLEKLEHSMGLIFQQLKNLENSIASSAVPSAPQAIISGNLFSILMQFYGFYVYLNLIITVFMQLHKCLTYVTLYTFFFTFTIAPMSSYAVPSASISSTVPSASISSAVPSAMLIKLNFLKKRVFPAFQPNIRDFYKSTLTK